MKTSIYKNHNAGTLYKEGDDAGSDISGLGLGNDDLLTGKKAGDNSGGSASQSQGGDNGSQGGQSSQETEEQKRVRLEGEQKANEEKTKLANIEIAKQHGGVGLDDKGNVIDVTGKVVKTSDEIKQANDEPQAVELDGVQYKLDKDGNALDKDGKVFKTKQELDAIELQDIPLIDEVQEKSGYKILDETGKPKVYEDSVEGIISFANDIAAEKAKEFQKKFFTDFPEVKDYAQFLARGGKVEDYFKQQSESWTNIKFDDKDEAMLINIVVSDLMKKGFSKEQADFTAKTYKDTDKLKEFGKAAYDRNIKEEKENKVKAENAYNQTLLEEQENTNKYWNNVNQVVNKGQINNITIPENERKDFFNYIGIAVDDNGNSKETLEKLTLEQELFLKYLKFKKFDASKLITSMANTLRVKSLRSRVVKGNQGVSGGEGINKDEFKKSNSDKISIDNLY